MTTKSAKPSVLYDAYTILDVFFTGLGLQYTLPIIGGENASSAIFGQGVLSIVLWFILW